MQASVPHLSIVIPAYREQRRIGATLDQLSDCLRTEPFFHGKQVEVLVVAAEAGDRTQAIVRQKIPLFDDCRLLLPGQRIGKGRDVAYGMRQARGRYAIFMDADLATPLHHLPALYQACTDGADVAIATRDLRHYRASRRRCLLAYVGNCLYRLTGGVQVPDTQCGFKMFRRQASDVCFSKLRMTSWGFDLELLTIARANHLAIRTIPVTDWQEKAYGTYTRNMFSIIRNMTRDHLLVSWRRLCRVYS